MTKGIIHKGELEQGPYGDLWSVLFHLIDGRSGHTDAVKVKSHLEDAGPTAIKQNKIAFHHMLCKPFGRRGGRGGGEASVARYESGTYSQKGHSASEFGVGVAKRWALVQADIWVKRGEAGDIYELDPLQREEDARTRSAIGW